MVQVSADASMKTGTAPTYAMALAVAANVNVEVSTSSPGPMPRAASDRCSAAVPLESATAYGTAAVAATSRSNSSTCGPSGATHPESTASRSSWRSSGPMSGGER